MDNKQYIYEYLTKKVGYNRAVACGIMANIKQESGFNPLNLQQTGEKQLGMTDEQYTKEVDEKRYAPEKFYHDGYGYGLCQWTWWSRKQELYKRTVLKNLSVGDMDAQLKYMLDEMRGYSELTKAIRNTKDTEQDAFDLAYDFCLIYEKPANMEARGIERGNMAKELYREYSQFQPYLIKVTKKKQKVRSGPGVKYGVNMIIEDKGTYTIVAEGGKDSKWGKLKSGAGWIYLPYVTKV